MAITKEGSITLEGIVLGALVAIVSFLLFAKAIRLLEDRDIEASRNQSSGGCFAPNTLVLMADGSEKSIREIVVGARVLGVNALGMRVPNVVTKVFVHDGPHMTVVINGALIATPNHPIAVRRFWFSKKWVEAGSLKVGNVMIGVKGSVRVMTIAPSEPLPTVYNLEVEKTHTYFAEGILVHNKK